MRVTLLDSGVGNLHSLARAVARVKPGADVVVSREVTQAIDSDVLILPGVGAFSHAAALIAPGRDALRAAIESGLPTIGICLGMQLLFDESEEGEGAGLGIIPGRVERLEVARLPHMGWSRVVAKRASGLPVEGSFYFAHSFVCRPRNDACIVAAARVEGVMVPAVVHAGRTLGFQFHPEKSSREGLALLAAAFAVVTQ